MSSKTRAKKAEPAWVARHTALIVVLAVMAFLVVVRLRVADIPLERDEGEYAYAGQLILQGIPPFELAYNMKFPGTYYAYAALMAVFGETAWGVHAGLMLVNAATILLVFFIARRLLQDPMGASVAAIAYGLLSVDRWSLAIFAHATHFVVAAGLAGLLLLLYAIDSKKAVWFAGAGVLLGVSALMKQNGIFFLALGIGIAAWSALEKPPRRYSTAMIRAIVVSAGAAIPVAAVFGLLYAKGVFGKFWFWTMDYAREYASQVPISTAWELLKTTLASITEANTLIWVVAALGVILLWVSPWSSHSRILLLALLLVSAASVMPGLFFRRHYFILLFPAISVFCGVAVVSLGRLLGNVMSSSAARAVAAGLFVIAAGAYVQKEWDYFFSIPTRQLSRIIYGVNPFVESVEIARYIQSHTAPDDRIAVVGSEPQIYFYANRKSATGYIYTYSLMEKQRYAARMQDEMIAEITAAHPKYVVFVSVAESWLRQKGAEPKILNWSDAYLRQCYRMVGVADIMPGRETGWAWDDAAPGYRPESNARLLTWERKSDTPCEVSS